MAKGQVKIEDIGGRVRLRWTYAGTRYVLSLGVPYNDRNVRYAQETANAIEVDMLHGTFDVSLFRYKRGTQQYTCTYLFDSFAATRLLNASESAKSEYKQARAVLTTYGLADRLASSVTFEDVKKLYSKYVACGSKAVTLRRRISLIKSAWRYGIKYRYVADNPWEALNIPNSPTQPPAPFTQEEIDILLNTLREPYCTFTKFLLGTGCRIGEAIALKWRHISPDYQTIWIGESVSRGVEKSTKTNTARTIHLSPSVSQLLSGIGRKDKDAYVFDVRNDVHFRNVWRWNCQRAGIPHRKPYNCRHTFVSRCLAHGIPATVVAAMTGHSVAVLYAHYAGYIGKTPTLPEMF